MRSDENRFRHDLLTLLRGSEVEEEEEEDEVKFIPMIILSMILPTGEGYGTELLHLELTPAATTLYTTLYLYL